jgi:hypothetical protein
MAKKRERVKLADGSIVEGEAVEDAPAVQEPQAQPVVPVAEPVEMTPRECIERDRVAAAAKGDPNADVDASKALAALYREEEIAAIEAERVRRAANGPPHVVENAARWAREELAALSVLKSAFDDIKWHRVSR